jgi:hypothetical protein
LVGSGRVYSSFKEVSFMKWSLTNIVIAVLIVFIFVLAKSSLFAQGIRITTPSLGTQGKPACVVLPVKVEWEINNEKDKNGVLQVYLDGNDKPIFPEQGVHEQSPSGIQLPLKVGKI